MSKHPAGGLAKPPAAALPPRHLVLSVAASLLLVLSGWWLVSHRWGTETVVARTGVKSVRLPDGSTAHLRQGSRLQYRRPYDEKRRAVTLEGEAFFEVQHSPAKPFLITAGAAEVAVLGTSFLVDERRDIVRVVVQAGSVRLRLAKDTSLAVVLAAGERGVLSGAEISKGRNSDANYRAWQTGMLVFNDVPLPQVAAALGNYYGVTLKLRPEEAAALSVQRVTITFNEELMPGALQRLAAATACRIRQVGQRTYELSRHTPPPAQ